MRTDYSYLCSYVPHSMELLLLNSRYFRALAIANFMQILHACLSYMIECKGVKLAKFQEKHISWEIRITMTYSQLLLQ